MRVVISGSPCEVSLSIAWTTSAAALLPNTAAESFRRASCASTVTAY